MNKYSRDIKLRRLDQKRKGEETKNNSQSATINHLSSKGTMLQAIVM
jgi:hypothetical protein